MLRFRRATIRWMAGACYQLGDPATAGRPSGLPERVRLADTVVPQGADSSWKRAIAIGVARTDVDLSWRAVDASTAELRVRQPKDTVVVRFRLTGTGPVAADGGTSVPMSRRGRVRLTRWEKEMGDGRRKAETGTALLHSQAMAVRGTGGRERRRASRSDRRQRRLITRRCSTNRTATRSSTPPAARPAARPPSRR